MEAFGTITSHISLAEFINKLEDVFDRYDNVPYRLLLSMELCTSSRIETNNRSRIILLVSALEALAEQRDLRDDLGTTVATLKATLNNAPIQDASLKSSLLGQISTLVRESASRAIRRLLQEHNISRSDVEFVKEAYAARSKIVHEGQRVPELDAMAGRLDQILLQLYQAY